MNCFIFHYFGMCGVVTQNMRVDRIVIIKKLEDEIKLVRGNAQSIF